MSASDERRFRCNHCGEMKPRGPSSGFWRDQWMCSKECIHASGDRRICYGWDCGCTRYSKKRRLLREHRVQMRVMESLIAEEGLGERLEDIMVEETGESQFHLGTDSEMDEDSDQEDPEAALRDENKDKQAFLEAGRCILEAHAVKLDLERARMRLEDMSGLR